MNVFCMFGGHDLGEPAAEYYGLDVCVPPDAHVEALIDNVMLFGDEAFER